MHVRLNSLFYSWLIMDSLGSNCVPSHTMDALDDSQALKSLLSERESRQAELERKVTELRGLLMDTPAGIDGPLIDPEGFPRDDCDLHTVRQLRHDLACAITDLRTITEERNALAAAVFSGAAPDSTTAMPPVASSAAADPSGPGVADVSGMDEVDIIRAAAASARAELEARNIPVPTTGGVSGIATDPSPKDDARYLQLVQSLDPIATVTAVAPGSPADVAEFKVGDAVVSFNFVTAAFDGPFEMMLAMIPRNVGRRMRVVVERASTGARIVLRVTPGPWAGGGVLGAALAPYSKATE